MIPPSSPCSPSSFSLLESALDSLPSLRLRKDIWTHFPVCLTKLPQSRDGHDRYVVQWHQKNLDVWCQKIPEYEHVVRIRLMHALMNSTRWAVEAPQQMGDLCIIAMQFSEEPRQFDTLPNIYAECTELCAVESIKEYFPVCWKKTRKNRHTLEFHNTLVRALAVQHNVAESEIRRITVDRLLPALKMGGWCVQMPTKSPTSEICTISN